MRFRDSTALALFLSVACLSGCSLTQKVFDSRPSDYVDSTDATGKDWTSDAAKAGRGNRARQTDPDLFWGYLQSPKSRDIERNFGYDHQIDQ